MRIIANHTDDKLRVEFKFSRFSVTKDYDATTSNDYSLRNLADESHLKIGYDKNSIF